MILHGGLEEMWQGSPSLDYNPSKIFHEGIFPQNCIPLSQTRSLTISEREKEKERDRSG